MIVVLAVIGGIVGGLNGGSQSTNDNSYEAVAQCEARIKDLLKAPSTAEFDSTPSGAGSNWKVTGTVDAENSFGAMIRADYGCTVTVHDTTATTKVDYFNE